MLDDISDKAPSTVLFWESKKANAGVKWYT